MSYYAIVLIPVRVELDAPSRILAGAEARDWARKQEPIGEHCAKVLSVEGQANAEHPLPPAA